MGRNLITHITGNFGKFLLTDRGSFIHSPRFLHRPFFIFIAFHSIAEKEVPSAYGHGVERVKIEPLTFVDLLVGTNNVLIR